MKGLMVTLHWLRPGPEMEQPAKVIGFGAVAIDDLIYVDRPLRNEKGRVTGRVTAHGGNVATALVVASTLGAPASFIGWISDHPDFVASISELHRHGVETAHAPFLSDAVPIRSVITIGSDGERFIAFDDRTPIGTDAEPGTDRIGGAALLLVDSYATHSLDAVRAAKAAGLTIVADIEWSAGEETNILMDMCDHLVLPWQFAEQLTGQADIRRMMDALWSQNRCAVVVTRGETGVFLRQRGDDTVWHQPAYHLEVIDTTGAGDCFHGAYCYGLAAGRHLKDCVRFANAAAALSTTAKGGRGLLPSRENVTALLASKNAPMMMPL